EKLKIHKLSVLLASMGIFVVSAGIAFLCPADPIVKYAITIVSFCGMQMVISIFSVFAVSLIQQKTPNHLIGKVMAYTSTITLCVQPIGQIVYGFLFDRFSNMISLCLIPTGIIVCAVGLSTAGFFKKMEEESLK
ncbi:MAG: MFS transporter, partial [Eubacterium sp.]|nr:MFS transporter [Eubacterium sp.]